jgi:phenylalanyl-tRNA synthetase beta chain
MRISYKWLSEYLPVTLEHDRLSKILTSVGLEVESLEKYEEIKGGFEGLVIGEVLTAEKHPNADKLTITKVNIGNGESLDIICGAPNVAAGQKVIVAPVGSTIYPIEGEPVQMKVAKIRGMESHGMICAEDEIGLGTSHAGIMVLPTDVKTGTPLQDYFHPYEDWIYEIGITPNRMDAMSHWGVARDVCAYVSHHEKKETRARLPVITDFKSDNKKLTIDVSIENVNACQRYSGVSIAGVTIKQSPSWLKQKLKAIGLRPINNIVDITNFIQHETGQPLHAFDANAINGKKIIVKNLPEGTQFVTLDEKERKLSAEDLMICDEEKGLCIAGVFGGIHSGVTEKTKNIFLESAWFNPVDIRKTSFRHGLRTDAATRFEKGIDISNTATVLKRAAVMIKEIAGGAIASEIIDKYPDPKPRNQIVLKYHYLKKLSGKNYHPDTVKDILKNLGFEVIKDGIDELWVSAPYHKPDVLLPADVVEEILRIDGLDNVEIPDRVLISPSVEQYYIKEANKEKLSSYMVGLGFDEIMTNPITNSKYFPTEELPGMVRMLNSLSADLDVMRPSMLETGLQVIAYNLNRKNPDIKFFEFGKSYHKISTTSYKETDHFCFYLSGNKTEMGWKNKPVQSDFYLLKGIAEKIFKLLGLQVNEYQLSENPKFESGLKGKLNDEVVIEAGIVHKKVLANFDIKQPVFFAELNWQLLSESKNKGVTTEADNLTKTEYTGIQVREIPKFPAVQRDLAIVLPGQIKYEDVRSSIQRTALPSLHDIKLFDIFESEKLGAGKKSMAINLTFMDEEKTLTDKEVDTWMNKIIGAVEKDLNAEIRK